MRRWFGKGRGCLSEAFIGKGKGKRNILGVSESELVDYIQRENLRIKSITKSIPKKDNIGAGHAHNSNVFLFRISKPVAHRKVTKNP